jgi:hypothetical protein
VKCLSLILFLIISWPLKAINLSIETRFHRVSQWRLEVINLLPHRERAAAFRLICRANFGSRFNSYSIIQSASGDGTRITDLMCAYHIPRPEVSEEEVQRQIRELHEVALLLRERDEVARLNRLEAARVNSLDRSRTKDFSPSSGGRRNRGSEARSQ